MSLVKTDSHDFGVIEFYECYAIGKIHQDTIVNSEIAKTILSSIKDHYGKRPMVYISDREFGHGVDLSVYKLIDHKKIVGIAIVSSHKEEIIITASAEQALYGGSFCVFNTLDSAVSWAKSFIESDEELPCD